MVYVTSETEFYQLKVKVTQSCPTLCDPMHYTVHGILQARILEWVAIPLSRESSQPMNQIQVSHNAGGFFTSWATREAQPAPERPFLKEILQKLFFAAVFFPNWQCSLSSVFWLGEFMLITSYFSESSCDTERMKSHWETRFCMHHVLRRAAAQIWSCWAPLSFFCDLLIARSQLSPVIVLSVFCAILVLTAMTMSWCSVSPWRTWIKLRGWLLASHLWPTPWPSLLSQKRYDPQHADTSICTGGPPFPCGPFNPAELLHSVCASC